MPWKQRDSVPQPLRRLHYRVASEAEAKAQRQATHRLLVELVSQERARKEKETYVPQQQQ